MTAARASNSTFRFLMPPINAQVVNGINARTANRVPHSPLVGKQPENEPSEFWARLVSAWGPKGLPTTQNGVATALDMSQGSTRRWYTGEGYPETKVLGDIAKRGGVTIDWLLTGQLPRSPIKESTPVGKLLSLWERLDEVGREHVYQAAIGQLAIRPQREDASKSASKHPSQRAGSI